MAMTLQERVSACSRDANNQETAFTRTIIGALARHARWVIRAGNQPATHEALAWSILNVPDAFAYRFGVNALTEPVYDAVTDADTITDESIQGTIAELWPLFAVEPEQA